MTVAAGAAPAVDAVSRPSALALVRDQVLFSVRETWRSRVVLIFTFVIPLMWLVVIGLVAGNAVLDPATGLRVMQFVTPTAAALGVLFAAYPTTAQGLALAREERIAKRLRGTPLPPWAYLAGRVGAAVALATASVAVTLGIGVLAYGVQVQPRSMAATIVTIALGVASFAALGLAVGALARSASVAQAFSVASGVALMFLSGMLAIGTEQPAWMTSIASLFPVRHLVTSLQDQFDPSKSGPGLDPIALAMIAVWGVAGLALARWGLAREGRVSATGSAARTTAARTDVRLAPIVVPRPRVTTLMLDQLGWATRAAVRDAGWIAFAVAMPVGLYALMCSMYADTGFRPNGLPFAFFFACGMMAYGAAVTAFIDMPEAVATARDRRVLKRLRGTPLTSIEYIVGRTLSALWIALVTGALVLAVGVGFFAVRASLEGVVVATAVLIVGTLTFSACGYALAAVAPGARASAVTGLAILLPLSFVSDVFVLGNTSEPWMTTLGSIFPLLHLVHALAAGLDPAGPSVAWVDIAVMGVWLVVATAIAARRFRWEPAR